MTPAPAKAAALPGSLRAAVEGPDGFTVMRALDGGELRSVRDAIEAQWLANLCAHAPQHAEAFRGRGIDRYHEMAHLVDHASLWPKRARILPAGAVATIRATRLCRLLEDELGAFEISDEEGLGREEIYWRIVRPGAVSDTGPVHADRWFWDLGHGRTPAGSERIKVWVAVVTEPGLSGLRVVPGSHRREWRYHGEMRDGFVKPCIDEDLDELDLRLLATEPGDAVVFNDRLLHGGGESRGALTRVSFELHDFRAGAARRYTRVIGAGKEAAGNAGAPLEAIARKLRATVIEMSHRAGSPHLGSCLSCIDILVAAYFDVLAIDASRADDPDRDRFILSKGHAAPALYAVLAERGFFGRELLERFNEDGAVLAEQPAPRCVPGLEAATGSLGHGLGLGAGMALGARIHGRSYRVFVLMSDGECNEGSVWEAAMFAPARGLGNLCTIVDYNRWQATGRSDEILALAPLADKWRAFGWRTLEVDGHDLKALAAAMRTVDARAAQPTAIVAHTVKGKGVSFMEDDNNWHYRIPKASEVDAARAELGVSAAQLGRRARK